MDNVEESRENWKADWGSTDRVTLDFQRNLEGLMMAKVGSGRWVDGNSRKGKSAEVGGTEFEVKGEHLHVVQAQRDAAECSPDLQTVVTHHPDWGLRERGDWLMKVEVGC